jgi:hypothetical protein
MWHIGENDLTDVHNFVPVMVIKVTKHFFEVMDDNNDICFALL